MPWTRVRRARKLWNADLAASYGLARDGEGHRHSNPTVNPYQNPDLSTDLHQVHMGSAPNIEDRPVECRVPSVRPSISAWQCLLEAGHRARELRARAQGQELPEVLLPMLSTNQLLQRWDQSRKKSELLNAQNSRDRTREQSDFPTSSKSCNTGFKKEIDSSSLEN